MTLTKISESCNVYIKTILVIFFFKDLFSYLFEREKACMNKQREGQSERESQADSVLSAELTTGLGPRTLRS